MKLLDIFLLQEVTQQRGHLQLLLKVMLSFLNQNDINQEEINWGQFIDKDGILVQVSGTFGLE